MTEAPKTHPEQADDEIFIGNFDPADFHHVGWKTKRLGVKAYDKFGDELPSKWGLRPGFRKASEEA